MNNANNNESKTNNNREERERQQSAVPVGLTPEDYHYDPFSLLSGEDSVIQIGERSWSTPSAFEVLGKEAVVGFDPVPKKSD